MSEKILLIDGHSIINRAFYAIPELTNSEGLHTNGIYGFLTILLKILGEEHPQYLAVAFDVKAPTFRHKLYGQYKGTRKAMPEELHEQVPVLKEVLEAMNIAVLEMPGFEADDILGTLAKKSESKGLLVSVLSGDRDLLQLATEKICIRIPKTRKGTTTVEDYFADDVVEAYGVTPHEFIDMKALMGDASDNIPGVPGIGEKTAGTLIKEWHSIENAYEHLSELTPPRARKMLGEHYEQAKLSKVLARIDTEVPVDLDDKTMELGNIFNEKTYQLFKRLEFKKLLGHFDQVDKTAGSIEESFICLTELEAVEDAFNEAMKADQTGFSLLQEKDSIYGAAISFSKNKTCFIPVQGFISGSYLAGKAEKLLLEGKGVICTLDLKLLLKSIKKEPLDQKKPSVWDLSVAAYLLNPLKSTYEYDDLARDYLNETFPSRTDLCAKRLLSTVAGESPDILLRLGSYAACTALLIKSDIEEELKAQGMLDLYLDVELPLIFSLHHMEQAGIRVRRDELKAYGDRLTGSIEALEASIYKQTGSTFNINSPKQLGEVLFEKMKLPYAKKTKSGYSTAADVLDKLAPEYQVVADILEYRQLTKLKSTYADGLANWIGEDERIHGSFNQTITATGRISSTDPNLQNIPIRMEMGREIRKVFVPEDGCCFIDADYSQIELRVLAHMSGDENLIEAYHTAQDIHTITASKVFHVPFDEVTPLLRRNAKAVNFGIVYGISAFGLSEDLSISRKEASAYIEQYFKTYPKVKEFLDNQVKEGKENTYVTSLFGRRRPMPELSSSNFMTRSFGERVAMNAPIQGTAADIIKIAMVRVDQRLRRENRRSRLILQVHDELLIEAYEDEREEVWQLLKEEMQSAAQLSVPLEVDIHDGYNWFEAK